MVIIYKLQAMLKTYTHLCLFLARQAPVGQRLLIHEVSRSHTTTNHSRQDSSGRVISSSQRPLYLRAHNTHSRQTSMPPVGFEPTISAGERPLTYALDRAATGIGLYQYLGVGFTNTQKTLISTHSPLTVRHVYVTPHIVTAHTNARL